MVRVLLTTHPPSVVNLSSNLFLLSYFFTDITKRLVPQTQSPLLQTTVAFFAYLSNTQLISPHQVLIFDHAPLNAGNGYHPNSGIFIVPKTGVYVFIWTIRMFKQSIIDLIVNGSIYVSIYNRSYDDPSGAVGADESVTGCAIVSVNQGDDVYLRTHSVHGDNARNMFSNEFGRSTFGGWILH